MLIQLDDEIVKDFLMEAGEILEQLDKQLVALEQSPDDLDLLNGIFRAFHTIKGGAGFLNIMPLVEVCHRAEDIFNVVRQGERRVEPALIDAVLEVLDAIQAMLVQIRSGEEPASADPSMLKRLRAFAAADQKAAESGRSAGRAMPAKGEEPGKAGLSGVEEDEMDEQEFERLLDALHGAGGAPGKPTTGKAEKKPAQQQALAVETTVRVATRRLDEIMNMVGELVLVRNQLQTLKSAHADEQIARAIANLDAVTSNLQAAVMKTRMLPIKNVFGRFPRLVRDLARSLRKEVRLELRGEETDLDKNLVEALADPLVHLVRNAVDHGIEMPDERLAAGKPQEGRVVLSASQAGDHIQLMIEDDGKGMSADGLRQKAVDKGLLDAETAARLDRRACLNLIFMPGFSTKSEISNISGRGVGMDVVKTRIAQMNGTVEIDSIEGKGSRIIIQLPLTLAIMPTLMVKLNGQPFALPLANVVEILKLDLCRTHRVDGQPVVMVRGHALPLFDLKEWLIRNYRQGTEKSRSHGYVVVVNGGGRYAGFVVDHLIGQEEVVIKALGAKLQGVPGLIGATITGDGMIALLLDVPGLMKRYAA